MPSWAALPVTDLIAGYTHVQRGRAAYRGALRATPKSAPRWTCACAPVHLTAEKARACAAAELERRVQGGQDVLTLLHCRPCAEGGGSAWWEDVPAAESLACPRCGAPLRRLKLVVVGSAPAVDEGSGKH